MEPRTAVIALLAVMAAGCTRPARHEPPAPPKAPYRSGVIQIGRWGVGPIRPGVYFETARIKDLFPLADIRETEVRVADDETMTVITVDQGGQRLLEIDDGTGNYPGTDDPMIGQVRGVGPSAQGPGGEHVGLPWTSAKFDFSECEIGSARDANHVVCARPGDGAVTYVFFVPGWESEEMPPEAMLRVKGYLGQIVWTPPRPGRS